MIAYLIRSRDEVKMEMNKMVLFIYGASGAGIEIYDLAERINHIENRYDRIFLIDDFQDETEYYGTRRIHFDSCKEYASIQKSDFIVAVGEPSSRKLLYKKIKEYGGRLTKLIDPNTVISPTAKIGEGCIVNYGSVISSNVTLEDNCFVMLEAIVGHDAYVNSHCVICPKASVGGHSIVGEESFIGIGSTIIQEVNVGSHAIVGMGSMVFREVPDGATVIGNPARMTKGGDNHKVFDKGDKHE